MWCTLCSLWQFVAKQLSADVCCLSLQHPNLTINYCILRGFRKTTPYATLPLLHPVWLILACSDQVNLDGSETMTDDITIWTPATCLFPKKSIGTWLQLNGYARNPMWCERALRLTGQWGSFELVLWKLTKKPSEAWKCVTRVTWVVLRIQSQKNVRFTKSSKTTSLFWMYSSNYYQTKLHIFFLHFGRPTNAVSLYSFQTLRSQCLTESWRFVFCWFSVRVWIPIQSECKSQCWVWPWYVM